MNPYKNLNDRSIWKRAVASRSLFDLEDIFRPSFQIRKYHKIATFGSCFAQHIGSRLKNNGYNWLESETVPPFANEELKRQYSYGLFSARTGNIYTASSLKQWVEWSLDFSVPPSEIWEKNGRYYDPFRPTVEPEGFSSEGELVMSRRQTLAALEHVLRTADVFAFTLGLTECWVNSEHGYEYAVCPGTVAGTFDPVKHEFVNRSFDSIRSDMLQVMKMIETVNPNIRFIVTVSPVPLVATASEQHVLVATMASKSILRAVAQDLVSSRVLPAIKAKERNVDLFNLEAIRHLKARSSLGSGATFRIIGSDFIVPDAIVSPDVNIIERKLVIHHKKDHGFIGMRLMLSLPADAVREGIAVKIVGNSSTSGKFDVYLSDSYQNIQNSVLVAVHNGAGPINIDSFVPCGAGSSYCLWIGSRTKGIDAEIILSEIKVRSFAHEEGVVDRVDYFPSYELINSPVVKGVFFERNEREVSKAGVDFVMKQFFSAYAGGDVPSVFDADSERTDFQEAICDEIIYEKQKI
ncbi:GSCFA domain-containing protein [Pseudomonas sp. R2.Fl]|nr:GSCFA domain-containing protein [Pseudomonas sp. R2.Fl]